MEVDGLPLHVLVIHGAVVFAPLAALLAFAHLLPALREPLRWPLAVTAVLAGGFVGLAYLSGQDFLERNPALGQLPAVADHERYAVWALVATLAFTAIALLATVLPTVAPVGGSLRIAVEVLLALTAVATLVTVFLTGDAGARAVWGLAE